MEKLSDKQVRAAELLAGGKTCREAAQEVGVTAETISHWKKRPVFAARYNWIREEIQSATMDSLRAVTGLAVKTLAELMTASNYPETRRKAAVDVLHMIGFDDPQRLQAQIGSSDPAALELERARRDSMLAMGLF